MPSTANIRANGVSDLRLLRQLEFFRQKPNGYESADTKSLSESIFCKQVRIAAALQDRAYADENYQNWRKILTETCRAEVGALNPELVSVRLHRQAVEHYQKPEAFVSLTETDKGTLMKEVAPLISLDDKDEAAKRFDNFVYACCSVNWKVCRGWAAPRNSCAIQRQCWKGKLPSHRCRRSCPSSGRCRQTNF